MERILGLTNSSKQVGTINVGNNETCEFKLYFLPTQKAWFLDWKYKNIQLKGCQIVLTPNFLRQFKTKIPFGLAFQSEDNIPPFQIEDFTNRVSMILLNKEDVEVVDEEFFSKNGN